MVGANTFSLAATVKILALKTVFITSFLINLGLWGLLETLYIIFVVFYISN